MIATRRDCLGGALLLPFAAASVARAARPVPGIEAGVNLAVGPAIKRGEIAGVSVAVRRGSDIIFAKGYGLANLETGTMVTPQTVFRVGSITKQFTAAVVLQLMQEGKLALDDAIARHLPEVKSAGRVTIRQLLTHTSGLHNFTEEMSILQQARNDFTNEQLLKLFGAMKPLFDFEPGTRWHYSNTGYAFAAIIAERVSGATLKSLLQQRIFTPLRMAATSIDDNADVVPHRASGYDRMGDATGRFVNTAYCSMTVPGGAGAMRSTAGDLLKWHKALFSGRVLRPDVAKLMMTPARLADGSVADATPPGMTASKLTYGMGLHMTTIGGQSQIGHEGAIFGFNAALDTYPARDVSIAVLTNTGGGADRVAPAIGAAVMKALV